MSEYVLIHHGVEGQKWGVQNGPPYPIDKGISKKVKRLNSLERKRANRVALMTDSGKKYVDKAIASGVGALMIASLASGGAFGAGAAFISSIGLTAASETAYYVSKPINKSKNKKAAKEMDQIIDELHDAGYSVNYSVKPKNKYGSLALTATYSVHKEV